MKLSFIVFFLVFIVGIFALVFLVQTINATGEYGSEIGHTYHYETGDSGITGQPDFIVTNGLGSVPICFDTAFEEGGFRTETTPQFTWDYVSCFVVQPEQLFGSDRGSLPVHCFLRYPYGMPQGLPHPAQCDIKGKEIRYQS